jgi:hypothetical protein
LSRGASFAANNSNYFELNRLCSSAKLCSSRATLPLSHFSSPPLSLCEITAALLLFLPLALMSVATVF